MALAIVAGGVGCKPPTVEVGTDRLAYTVAPGDTAAAVRLTIRNGTRRPVYVLTVDGRADVLWMIRVEAAAGEVWSLLDDPERLGGAKLGVARLDPDSSYQSTYQLRRGEYWASLRFSNHPDSVDQQGLRLERFSIR